LVRPEVESRVRTIEIASGEIAGGEIAGGEIAGGEIAGDSQRPPSGARAETQERAASAVERIR
jgi:hypothetical protein